MKVSIIVQTKDLSQFMLCKHSTTYQMENLTDASKAEMIASRSVSLMAATKAQLTEELKAETMASMSVSSMAHLTEVSKAAMMVLSLMSKKASCSE